jgi:hypothetical protein
MHERNDFFAGRSIEGMGARTMAEPEPGASTEVRTWDNGSDGGEDRRGEGWRGTRDDEGDGDGKRKVIEDRTRS